MEAACLYDLQHAMTNLQEQQAGHVLEVLLNGVRVFAGATPSLSRPQDHSFAITAKELPQLHDSTVHLKVVCQ